MNDLYENYPWVPFFQELAKAILKYKDDRKPLLAWLKRDLSGLKSREKKAFWFCKKITDPARNDIDPFSIFAILCKKYNYETLERILPIFKDFFKIQADASSSDWGLITTNTPHFFFTNNNNEINTLWNIFEKALSDKDFEKEFDIIQEKFTSDYLTYSLSWICPYKYLGLSPNVKAFMRPFFDVNIKFNYTAYKQLLKQANRLIEEKTLACNSLVQLTEIAQRGNMADQIWFIPGTPQDLKDGKILLKKNLLRELLTNYGMLSAANPRTDTVVLYGADTSGNNSSICLYMWGKFLPHKIKMKSDMLSHIEWHSYGNKTINYKKDNHFEIFCENATAELLNLLRINTENNNKASNMETNHQKRINEFITLLEANKNLILTGAPGTGKTFMAKEIAKALITNTINQYKFYNVEYLEATNNFIVLKNILDTQIVMVQFHPSYDYTDFVEGLRPIKNEEGQIGFERSDGAFKSFCKNHYGRYVVIKKSDDNNSFVDGLGGLYYKCYRSAVADIDAGHNGLWYPSEYNSSPAASRYYTFSVEHKEYEYEDEEDCIMDGDTSWVDHPDFSSDLFYCLIQSHDDIFERRYPSKENIKEKIIELWRRTNSEKQWKQRNSNFNIESIDSSCPIFEIDRVVDFYYTLFYWIIDYAYCHYERLYLPSVLIIDEINRGEISKIFGELFFSIDPGYRGEYDRNGNDNKVLTQYQNLIGDDDVFKNGFYVPDNIYIIGTMNDIDRSVESLDFAMHRRFAFEKVTAKESYQNMIAESDEFSKDEKEEIKKRMFALNDAICEPELKLGEAYQIGAAYFRKYLYYKELGMEHAFTMLWKNHLKGLLFEYLRGNQNAENQLRELEKAYNKKDETHEETDSDNG